MTDPATNVWVVQGDPGVDVVSVTDAQGNTWLKAPVDLAGRLDKLEAVAAASRLRLAHDNAMEEYGACVYGSNAGWNRWCEAEEVIIAEMQAAQDALDPLPPNDGGLTMITGPIERVERDQEENGWCVHSYLDREGEMLEMVKHPKRQGCPDLPRWFREQIQSPEEVISGQ